MVTLVCNQCNKEYEVINTRKETSYYCSRKCSDESKKGKTNSTCTYCGKQFHVKLFRINKYTRNMGIFCSRACSTEQKKVFMLGQNNHQFGLKGKLNSSFVDGLTRITNGKGVYLERYLPLHPKANKNGRIKEHVYVVETNYSIYDSKFFDFLETGIYLKKGYEIHHIDKNTLNNNTNNLLIVTRAEHTSIHCKGKKIIRDTKGRITAVKKSDKLLENQEIDNQQPS
jgi:hypothetical protein